MLSPGIFAWIYTAEISGKLRRSYCVPFLTFVVIANFPPLTEMLWQFLNIDIASGSTLVRTREKSSFTTLLTVRWFHATSG